MTYAKETCVVKSKIRLRWHKNGPSEWTTWFRKIVITNYNSWIHIVIIMHTCQRHRCVQWWANKWNLIYAYMHESYKLNN